MLPPERPARAQAAWSSPLKKGDPLFNTLLLAIYALTWPLAPFSAKAQQSVYSAGNPTDYEQLMLELINRARANPAAEAARFGIDLNADLPAGTISAAAKAPFASHPSLITAARKHSDWMIQTGIFSHTGQGGSTPTDRARWEGFAHGVAENISWKGTSGRVDPKAFTESAHEALFRSAGHRRNTMNPAQVVAGIGLRSGSFQGLNAWMTTAKFSSGGDSLASGPFILGVAYDDRNGNNFYDPGEGVSGLEVRPHTGSYYAITSSSGGYAIPIPPTEVPGTQVVQLPFPVNGTPWSSVEPYDLNFRQQKLDAALPVYVTLRFSGHGLESPATETVQMKASRRINYRLRGTDGYFYDRLMVTSQNVKVDFQLNSRGMGVASADFNLDGNADLLWRHSRTGANVAWLMSGGDRIGAVALPAVPATTGWTIAGLGDFNGDARVDILWRNVITGQNLAWFMHGSIRTGAGIIPSVSIASGWDIVGLGDFNEDTKIDILWHNRNTGQNLVWFMDGTSRTGAALLPPVGAHGAWQIKGTGDFNADGKPDILWRNHSTGGSVVWFMDGTTRSGLGHLQTVSTASGWTIQGLVDINNDDHSDILWRNTLTGANVVWIMHGIHRTNAILIPAVFDAAWSVAN